MSSISSMLSPDNIPSSTPPVESAAELKDTHQPAQEPSEDTTDKETTTDAQHQRKRSKVSRACDECRRKKIKCDATFKAHSNTLEKTCSSCSKNGYACSFDRVPLKRGPTKGYVKSDQNNLQGKNGERYTNIQPQPQSQGSSITLPPLTSITTFQQGQQTQAVPQQRQGQSSQPASPRRGSFKNDSISQQVGNPGNPNGSVPQSQFWKVPYEAPFDRRGSVDSISSSISDARLSAPRHSSNFSFTNARFGDSVISDSDDERSNLSPRGSIDIRNRSRSNSGSLITAQNLPSGIPTSPALSISSLRSLNQGMSKNLSFNPPNPQQFHFQPSEHSSISGPLSGQAPQPQANTNHLVDSYYRFVHPNLPVLPLSNHTLVNILANPPPLQQNEFDEISYFVVQSFYSSLDLLISVLSKQNSPTSSPSIVGNQLAYFTETLNVSFYKLSKLFPKIAEDFEKFPQQTVILFLSNLALLSYVVVLLGYRNDVVIISSSIQLLNRLRIFKIFWTENIKVGTENFDDFSYSLRRLWLTMHILNTLHCLSHGLAITTSLELTVEGVDKLLPNFQGTERMRDGFKLGWILSQIAKDRDYTGEQKSGTILSELKKVGITSTDNALFKHNENNDSSLPYQFSQQIYTKLEIIAFLDEIKQSLGHNEDFDEELLYDHQLKLSRLIRKQLSTQSSLFQCLKNPSNSIDQNIPGCLVSPFIPLIFKQSIKTLNILKILINSLQLNESLVSRLSKLLNELISLTNSLSQIKPFISNELNNHLRFELHSENLEFWENDDKLKAASSGNNGSKFIKKRWIGLILDILDYSKKEDYEGWF